MQTSSFRWGSIATIAAALLLALAPAASAAGVQTERIDLSATGHQTNGDTMDTSISADGRFVAFSSLASNLLPGDTNGTWDVFVADRENDTVSRASVSTQGVEGDMASYHPDISADGRFVVFDSRATNLVYHDTNDDYDVYAHNLVSGVTTRVSVSAVGGPGGGISPSVSDDGRFVAFTSFAADLVLDDANGQTDVFVRDRETHTSSLVSLSTTEEQTDNTSGSPAISGDGQRVAFASSATNLVPGDTNGATDVFVRNLAAGTTRRLSVSSSGRQGDGGSGTPAISANGRVVAFTSDASNLVPGDGNGFTDVFARDRRTHATRRVSISTAGAEGTDVSELPAAVSANGRYVAFTSMAPNLVPGDTNNVMDVFVRDRSLQRTTRISVATGGGQANQGSYQPAIAGKGRFIAFASEAMNLVSGDTNDWADIFVRGPFV